MSSLPGINTNDKPITHPTPAEAYELACNYAALLRALYTNPQFRFQETPTPEIAKVSKETHMGLFFVTDFVENTYVKHVLPYLPAGASRHCRALANPWAYADPSYVWTWEWDPESQTMWDKKGSDAEEEEEVPFPTFPESDAREMVSDIWTRGFMAQKIIVENETDPKARALAGGQPFDFGPEARELVKKVGIPEKGVPK
ncbi:uncharacterized protein PG998_001119 [Apiospora kogelbergensis]|uniref:uncharacterized protein n=1 Tax=Apiospora kogelbergensis TaxID=1337665 RepID=UPI0031309A78